MSFIVIVVRITIALVVDIDIVSVMLIVKHVVNSLASLVTSLVLDMAGYSKQSGRVLKKRVAAKPRSCGCICRHVESARHLVCDTRGLVTCIVIVIRITIDLDIDFGRAPLIFKENHRNITNPRLKTCKANTQSSA